MPQTRHHTLVPIHLKPPIPIYTETLFAFPHIQIQYFYMPKAKINSGFFFKIRIFTEFYNIRLPNKNWFLFK